MVFPWKPRVRAEFPALVHPKTILDKVCRYSTQTKESTEIMFLRPSNLYRAFFCAIGLVMIIVGLECLAIESALFSPGIFEDTATASQQNPWFNSQPQIPQGKIFRPKDWFPWSLLAIGSIVAIYSQAVRNPSPIG